jgi:hypothetical protein
MHCMSRTEESRRIVKRVQEEENQPGPSRIQKRPEPKTELDANFVYQIMTIKLILYVRFVKKHLCKTHAIHLCPNCDSTK